ncbi:hypothetical protein CEXT_713881 [Caerostris extrusa]|uniref:Uncharacterized protein n=1 Tax=Caerostris extrusa TaxID=172846 RepID=A0AAV4S8S3_CAEEX|nr:hypothetical protein CEXT_713881 [Caerostris extrusa]
MFLIPPLEDIRSGGGFVARWMAFPLDDLGDEQVILPSVEDVHPGLLRVCFKSFGTENVFSLTSSLVWLITSYSQQTAG